MPSEWENAVSFDDQIIRQIQQTSQYKLFLLSYDNLIIIHRPKYYVKILAITSLFEI
jgi:hypothetical protein